MVNLPDIWVIESLDSRFVNYMPALKFLHVLISTNWTFSGCETMLSDQWHKFGNGLTCRLINNHRERSAEAWERETKDFILILPL